MLHSEHLTLHGYASNKDNTYLYNVLNMRCLEKD